MTTTTTHHKNILFLSYYPFAGEGGVGRVTEVLTKEFLHRGFGITYLALCAGKECITNDVTQHFVPDADNICCKENINFVSTLINTLSIDVIINQAGGKKDVINFLKKVHVTTPILSVHHNCVKCLQENYQHVLTESFKTKILFKLIDHPIGWFFLNYYHLLKQGHLFKRTILTSDKLVLLSDTFLAEMKMYVPNVPDRSITAIPNPASFPVVEGIEAKKENRLVFVGRLFYQQKRADLLIELWKQIYRDFPDWHFDIVGDGKDRLELEKRARALNLERIYFHGFQDPRPYLEKAKFFCMTSAFEGFGMVLVEAQAYGVVPFAFNCFSALPDIIQSGDNGFVFPKFDMVQYTDTLKQLMTNEVLRQQLAKNCLASVAKFDPAHIGDRWENLFNELKQKRKSRANK